MLFKPGVEMDRLWEMHLRPPMLGKLGV